MGRGLAAASNSALPPPSHVTPAGTMRPPGLLLLLVGLAAAEGEGGLCLPSLGPIAALAGADLVLTLLIAGAAYWLAGRSRAAPLKTRPPEPESTYQELQGTRGDLYSELKR